MDIRKGRYFINGIDLWDAFGIFIQKGSDDFLKLPERKDSITHDWMDTNGIDIDLSTPFFKEKSIALDCAMIAADATDFWTKYQQFVSLISQPGLLRFEPTHLGRFFFVYYKNCSTYQKLTKLNSGGVIYVATKFTINIVEANPDTNNQNVYIIDEAGRFLIT